MPSYVKTPWMLSENGLKLQCSLMTTVRNYACKFYMSWHFQLQMTKSQFSSDSAQRWALSGRWNRDGYCETRSLGRWEGRPLWCEEESVRPETSGNAWAQLSQLRRGVLWLKPRSPGLHLYGLCCSTLGYIHCLWAPGSLETGASSKCDILI